MNPSRKEQFALDALAGFTYLMYGIIIAGFVYLGVHLFGAKLLGVPALVALCWLTGRIARPLTDWMFPTR